MGENKREIEDTRQNPPLKDAPRTGQRLNARFFPPCTGLRCSRPNGTYFEETLTPSECPYPTHYRIFLEHERLAARTHEGRENMKSGLVGSSLLAVFLMGATGCQVKVDKSGDGDHVKIATPFGGIAVNKDQTSAAELGLPAYPGAGGRHVGQTARSRPKSIWGSAPSSCG